MPSLECRRCGKELAPTDRMIRHHDPCHICTGTGLTPATSAPGLGSPLPHLRRDCSREPQLTRRLVRDRARHSTPSSAPWSTRPASRSCGCLVVCSPVVCQRHRHSPPFATPNEALVCCGSPGVNSHEPSAERRPLTCTRAWRSGRMGAHARAVHALFFCSLGHAGCRRCAGHLGRIWSGQV